MATTKTVTGTYKTGYTLASGYRILSITSTGSIEGSGLTIPSQSPDLVAVYNLGSIYNTGLGGPAAVTLDGVTRFVNGDATDTSVTVNADESAVYAPTGSQYSRVINYGTLIGNNSEIFVPALLLKVAQGSVRNGTDSDTTAVIEGSGGIYISTDGLVANYGTIGSNGSRDTLAAVEFANGGTFTNGSAQDPRALASGYIGFDVLAGAGQLTNYGVVLAVLPGGYYQAAVILDGGGSIDNIGRISGPSGVVISGAAGTVLNDGRVIGYRFSGISVEAGGTIVNGSARDQSALIGGHEVGVALTAGGGLTNFGVIASDISGYGFGVSISGGTVVNGSAADTAAVIEGWGGLDLGVGSSGSNYGLIEGLGAYGAAVVDNSRLTNGASDDRTASIEGPLGVTLVSHSEVTNFGSIIGSGGVAVSLDATSRLVAEAGAVFEGAVLGGGGTLELADGVGTLSGLGAAGALTGALAVTFSGFGSYVIDGPAAWTLSGASSLAAGQRLTDFGSLTLAGSLANAGDVSVRGRGAVSVAATGASLTGDGHVDLANNMVRGATAAATLTNASRLEGAGNIGGGTMTLVNAAAGTIDGDDTLALTINTGASTISNAGVIENTGAGGTTIKSALDNTGVLFVTKGALTLDGAVTGTGKVLIGGGTADLASSFSQNVTFRAGSTGTLELADSRAYQGAISGFSLTGATALDLGDIKFVSAGEATFVENAAKTKGVLTITDGTHTAKITLIGNFSTSTFVASSDGHGGTRVVDPSVPALGAGVMPATGPQTHPFIAAMAGLGKIPGAASPGVDFWRAPAPELAMSRAQFA